MTVTNVFFQNFLVMSLTHRPKPRPLCFLLLPPPPNQALYAQSAPLYTLYTNSSSFKAFPGMRVPGIRKGLGNPIRSSGSTAAPVLPQEPLGSFPPGGLSSQQDSPEPQDNGNSTASKERKLTESPALSEQSV